VSQEDVVASFLPDIDPWINPNLMSFDIWPHSIVALEKAMDGQTMIDPPLHLLSTF